MTFNLDFCFIDNSLIVAVTGWTTEMRPNVFLQVNDNELRPIHISRHVRRDLRSSEPLGIVALFDLSHSVCPADLSNVTIHLRADEEFEEIPASRLTEDSARLVEVGVDEVFFAVMRLLAESRLHFDDIGTGRQICTRLRMVPSAPHETEDYVLAVDRCQTSMSGQGTMIGWFLPASVSSESLCALAMDDEMLVPIELFSGSMARADLSSYASRYRFTGRDGFVGGWRFPNPPSGTIRLLVIVPGQDYTSSIMILPDRTDHADLAQSVTTAVSSIDDVTIRLQLRRSLLPTNLPQVLTIGDVTAAGDDASDPGEVLLILDHDLPDNHLRDVLRRLGAHLRGPLLLYLLRPQLTEQLSNSIYGAAREIDVNLQLTDVSMQIHSPSTPPPMVVFARSSTLFQFDAAQILAPITADEPVARLLILDLIGTMASNPLTTAWRFTRDLLPFAMSIRGRAFFNLLAQIPYCFLTEEARLRMLAEKLVDSDSARVLRTDIYRFFEGKEGPHSSRFSDGRDWHTYDAESYRLINGRTSI